MAASSVLMQTANACVQADIISISNTNGVITDYESNEDELAVWMGVNDDIMITWQDK